MSPEIVVALCTGIVSIIAALGALLGTLRNQHAIKTDAAHKDQKFKEIKADARSKDEQLAQIHVLVNDQMSRALREIADLRGYIAATTALIAKASKLPVDEGIARQAAAVAEVAQQKAETAQAGGVPPPPLPTPEEP